MGTAPSTLSRLPDQSTIANKTQTTSFVMNRILEYILKNVTMADLISLGTDEGCKAWIVIAEKKLKVLFKSFDLYPTSVFGSNSEGPIYFAKIKDLQEKTTSEPFAKAEKDKYCKILAFFYIRLFQIVGALALSVQDSSLPLQDLMPGIQESFKNDVPRREQVAPFIPMEQKRKRFKFFGGATVDYPFMTNYLRLNEDGTTYAFTSFPEKSRVSGAVNQFNTKRQTYPGIIVTKDDKYHFDITRKNTSLNFDFYMEGDKVIINNVYKAGVSLKAFNISDISALQDNGKLIVGSDNKDFADYIHEIINKILNVEQSQIINVLKQTNYLKKVDEDTFRIIDTHIILSLKELKKDTPTFLYAVETTIENKKVDIDIEFNMDLTKKEDKKLELSITNLRTKSKSYNVPPLKKSKFIFKIDNGELTFDDDSEPNLKRNKQTIPRFLESQFNNLTDKIVEALTYGFGKQREGYVRPLVNVKSSSSLKYTELWETLQKTPPIKSFCVARALQLLNLSGLSQQMPQAVLPLVYKSKFEYIENKSLPHPGKAIVDSAPFKALEQLYISPSTIPSLHIDPNFLPENSTKDASLLKLLSAFEQQNQTLATIIEQSGTEFSLVTDKTKISALRYQAKQLFQTQFNHTSAVLTLIKKIFNINGPLIEFKQSIASQGLRGIESIAQEARDLLTDYYSNCQTEFAKGIKILETS